ncbi:hypothetical protein FACS1894153_3370 [Bacteroidia bacterium]|nr:hypothetical protein FACS1894153_3370 [Bacteroidia bacterium]
MAQKNIQTKTNKVQRQPMFDFAFGKENYILLIAGVVILALGYILMIGGGSKDPNVFSYDLFSTTRLTVSPILIMLGFAIEFYAIMKKPKDRKEITEA